MRVLAVDCATPVCSVALYSDGTLWRDQSTIRRAHAEQLLPMLDALLARGGVTLRAIDRFAFGRGPGGLTGVRVAASAVQAFGYALGKPVVAISNLRAQALAAREAGAGNHVLVLQAAGEGQVYTGAFEGEALDVVGEERFMSLVDLLAGGPLAGDTVTGTAAGWLETGPALVEASAAAAQIATLAAAADAQAVAATDREAQPRYFRHPVHG